MPIAGQPGTPNAARSLEGGMLLIGAGAVLLLVSLFLEWYQPGVDAWEIFEVWDLVLAVLAIVALVAVAGRLGFAAPRPASWLATPALATLVIVLYAIVDPPPLVGSLGDGDPATGLWLALAASILMAAGAVLSVARISVAITAAEPRVVDPGAPMAGRRFRRGAAPVAPDPVDPVNPVAPAGRTAAPPTEPTRRL